ncbi:hypothetical protein BGZ80_005564 [Entomortierella chlamydospora]|uniref:Uncharacterized protein n=1 Tax=Entomortierella chlamydospora TaxID=101097 RepID=A0A9P6MZP4_9FUNG|nr:hypothetical protein BGZ80_005564 [Entomortierella chlamydospora]
MTTDWDPSRDYDSQTFSEDFNLHGASGRSLDHPSVTRDHINILDLTDGRGDDNSIDNADLDLIADIVDGKAPHQSRNQRTPARWSAHQADDNSEGFKSPALRFGTPARQGSNLGPGAVTATAIPGKVTTKKIATTDIPPKPIFRSALKSTNNGANGNGGQTAKSKIGRHIQLPTEILNGDDEPDQPKQKPDHIDIRGRHEPEEQQSEQIEQAQREHKQEEQQEEEQEQERNQEEQGQEEQDQEEQDQGEQDQGQDQEGLVQEELDQGEQGQEEQDQDQDQEYSQDKDEDLSTIDTKGAAPTTVARSISSIPGPSRFTRITKNNVSPGKKSIATIPTPLDDGNEQVQKKIKELKAMLGRLGLLPLSSTLESSLDVLDVATVEKGGICETVDLLQKLGGMYEKQKEVIHQMTDQIIASETRSERDPEADEMIQEMARELKVVKAELDEMKKKNQILESNSANMARELRRAQAAREDSIQQTEQIKGRLLIDAESQVSGNWGSIEELLDKKADGSRIMLSKRQSQRSEVSPSPYWRAHIQKIERELQALKDKLDRQPASSSPSLGAASDTGGLEDKMDEILLDNQRLKQKNKSLAMELLRLQEANSADEQRSRDLKYKALLKDVMARLGVDHQQDVLPALNEIERTVRDLPNLRRFVAKAERIIWESEIIEGIVKVQKYSRSSLASDLDGAELSVKGISESHNKNGSSGPIIKAGRTCSRGYEETLQRLKEWSELLDVLNHVEFADDMEDESTITDTTQPLS